MSVCTSTWVGEAAFLVCSVIVNVFTGKAGDEGWFALTVVPEEWNGAGRTDDGFRNYVGVTQPDGKIKVGKGLGRGKKKPQKLLKKVPGVTPLRAAGLESLVGQQVCAVVQDKDVKVHYYPLKGNLKGKSLGRVAFTVLSVSPSASALPAGDLPIVIDF